MTLPTRQQELHQLIQDVFASSPELSKTLDLFKIVQAEYVRALAAMTTVEIVASNSSDLGAGPRKNHAILDQD